MLFTVEHKCYILMMYYCNQSLAISCVLKQIEKPDKKQLSLRFYPYENLLFLVEKLLHPRRCEIAVPDVHFCVLQSRGKWETGFSILKFIDASAIRDFNY
ncbi:conserved hypothetical protein [Trichinella spiralis]|uniref:hypothetical protein n=1 Tax=Trichinella spiralis TaxID=6334 RepID=UPI0001EFCFCF|nr:conserved hypothetical protein [Trichinella spiralis]